MGKPGSGHLYVINGDVGRVACDAWLLPADARFHVTEKFAQHVAPRHRGVPVDIPDDGYAGDRCVLYRQAADDQPDLWIGDVGRSGADLAHYSRVAARFVERAAETVRGRVATGTVPLIAIPVIGSGDGGKRWARGPLLKELIPTLDRAAEEFGCDVVLVTYGAIMYSAAQAVRHELIDKDRLWAGLPHALRRTAEELGERAKAGGLVLFMGAGVSRGAGVPVWRELLHHIGNELGMTDVEIDSLAGLDPRDQATVLSKKSPERFPEAVARAMAKERYSLTHGLLASLPVKETVTTNFDTLFESASNIDGRRIAVVPGDAITLDQRWLLKLHGTIGKDLVFTRGEFIESIARRSALRGLVQAMLLTRHMLFVGYSLTDDDFHQLVHEVRMAVDGTDHRRMGTVLTFNADEHTELLWPELSFVSVDNSARTLQILLDMVGAVASSPIGFVYDHTIEEIGGDDEIELAEILARLDALASRNRGWTEVAAFVDRFRP